MRPGPATSSPPCCLSAIGPGPKHPRTLNTNASLAGPGRQGMRPEPATCMRDLLPVTERVMGAEHPDTLDVRASLGLLGHAGAEP